MASVQTPSRPSADTALAGGSSSAGLRKQARLQQRRLQKQWISLIDQWTTLSGEINEAGYTQHSPLADTVDLLVEQISHYAQQICKAIHDRHWLVSALQMGVSAVLLDDTDLQKHVDNGRQGIPASLFVQLGQQLLQLGIHTVIQPLLNQADPTPPAHPAELQAWATAKPQAAFLLMALKEFEHLSQRLSDIQRLVASSPDLEFDRQLVSVCLHQEASSVLLWCCHLPEPSQIVQRLLQHDVELRREAYPFRLTVLASLLRAGGVEATTLEHLDLLVGFKQGRETGLWAFQAGADGTSSGELLEALTQCDLPQPALLPGLAQRQGRPEPLSGTDAIVGFYIAQIRSLQRDFDLPELALDLCQSVRRIVELPAQSQGQNELARVGAELATLSALNDESSSVASPKKALNSSALSTMDPLDVGEHLLRSTLKDIDSATPSTASEAGARAIERITQYRKAVADGDDALELLISSLLQLLDSGDASIGDRARLLAAAVVLNVPASAASGSSRSAVQLRGLLMAALYSRGEAAADRIGMETSATSLRFLAESLDTLTTSSESSPGFLRALREAILRDREITLGARQIYAWTSGAGDAALAATATSTTSSRQHLVWLEELQKIALGNPMPTGNDADSKLLSLDMRWMLAFGGSEGDQKSQRSQLTSLVEVFATLDVSTSTRRGGRTDVADLRRRAKWGAFIKSVPELVSSSGPFAALPTEEAMETVLAGSVKVGDLDLFRSLLSDSAVTEGLSDGRIERLVLSVSTSLFDTAIVASVRSGEMRLASEVLDVISPSPRIRLQKNFIEAACRFCAFRIRSPQDPSQTIIAKEVRVTKDRMVLVSRLLAQKEDAYRSPELVLELAAKLCAVGPASVGDARDEDADDEAGLTPSQMTMVEIRTLAMLADTATTAGDFEVGAGFCARLVDRIAVLRKEAEIHSGHVATSTSSSSPGSAASILPVATELGWKTCYQLSKHPGWEDTPQRLHLLSHVLTLCPASRLATMLKTWKRIDEQLNEEISEGKTFTSTKKAVAVGGGGGFSAPRDAAAAAAGLMGIGANAAVNLLPMGFSPLSFFGGGGGSAAASGATSQEARTVEGTTSSLHGGYSSRAAQLFDFDAAGNNTRPSSTAGGGYLGGHEAAERATRAARAAARNFLGGWTNASSSAASSPRPGNEPLPTNEDGSTRQQEREGEGAGGFSLTRGVGWLIGEDGGRR